MLATQKQRTSLRTKDLIMFLILYKSCGVRVAEFLGYKYIYTYIYINTPRTQMTLVLIGKGLVLGRVDLQK